MRAPRASCGLGEVAGCLFRGFHEESAHAGTTGRSFPSDNPGHPGIRTKEYTGNSKGRNVPALNQQFTRRDANKDGKLTLEELKRTK